jgi:transcription elongation factor Elf1
MTCPECGAEIELEKAVGIYRFIYCFTCRQWFQMFIRVEAD